MSLQQSARRSALACGVLYLLTFIGSIAAAILIDPVIADPNYVTGPGADTRVALGAVFELVNVLACFGSAVAVFSIVKRQHEGLALGFVATRMFEAAVIAAGVVGVLTLVTLRQAAVASGDPDAFTPVGQAMTAVRHWSYVIGPGMASFNALMFATLLFRSRLVPRAIPALGLIGAPVFIVFVVGTILGVTSAGTLFQLIAVAPFFIWELAVGLWMTFKGFDESSPILSGSSTVPAPTSSALTTAAGAA
jgi:hypothetical protein